MITIGADPACTVALNDPAVALEQAVLIVEKSQWLLINKAPGTSLNGEPLAREARRPVATGDTLGARDHVINVVYAGPLLPDSPASRPESGGPRDPTAPPRGAGGTDERRSPTTTAPATESENPTRNFAKILEGLRTVEDSFYFVVEGGAQAGRRVTIETTAMLLGWDQSGRDISFEAGTIATPRAVVRKDWRGVFVQPVGGEAISVNDEGVDSERRLRDGDRLKLSPHAPARGAAEPYLIFHEPATLAVLDSLYQPKPEPVVAAREPAAGGAGDAETRASPPRSLAGFFSTGRKYFGYFTLLDLLMMCVATLATAGIFFLVLIYLKPVR
ncbi:MAG TPA: FHA domain-containing protein [Pyrinomonadaceae bacterium]